MNEYFAKHRETIHIASINAFQILSAVSDDLAKMQTEQPDRHADITNIQGLMVKLQDAAYAFEECRLLTKKLPRPGRKTN